MANILRTDKKVAVISMLAEGASIRSVERITGINQNTIMSLARRIGDACKRIMDEKMRDLNCKQIEIDEIWGFIGAKQKNSRRAGAYGDVWTFIALDAETKIIPTFVVGRRDSYHARAFMDDLAGRMVNRIQVSTDALAAYPDAVERGFGSEIDYGQIVKTYTLTNLNKDAASRYSPCEVVKVERTVVSGMPRPATTGLNPAWFIRARFDCPPMLNQPPTSNPPGSSTIDHTALTLPPGSKSSTSGECPGVGVTVMLTVALTKPPWPSLALKVKLSGPL